MMIHLRIGLMVGAYAAVLTVWSFLYRAQQPKGGYGFLLLLALTTYFVRSLKRPVLDKSGERV